MSETYPVIILPSRIHLTLKHCVSLFGSNEADELNSMRSGDFRPTKFSVTVTGPAGELQSVPLWLPLSESISLVMVTLSENRKLGLNAPVCFRPTKCSTPGARITGPAGQVTLTSGVNVPQRRFYFRPGKATNPHMREGDLVFAAPHMEKMTERRKRVLIFGDVAVLYHKHYKQGFYIDSEEAAAANLVTGDMVRVLGKSTLPEHRSDRNINKKKRLITENDVRRAVMNRTTIEVEPWMIVTPAALELGKARNVLKGI